MVICSIYCFCMHPLKNKMLPVIDNKILVITTFDLLLYWKCCWEKDDFFKPERGNSWPPAPTAWHLTYFSQTTWFLHTYGTEKQVGRHERLNFLTPNLTRNTHGNAFDFSEVTFSSEDEWLYFLRQCFAYSLPLRRQDIRSELPIVSMQ